MILLSLWDSLPARNSLSQSAWPGDRAETLSSLYLYLRRNGTKLPQPRQCGVAWRDVGVIDIDGPCSSRRPALATATTKAREPGALCPPNYPSPRRPPRPCSRKWRSGGSCPGEPCRGSGCLRGYLRFPPSTPGSSSQVQSLGAHVGLKVTAANGRTSL